MITGIHHVHITIPPGSEDAAREFYCGFLGLPEIDKPASLQGRGGLWLRAGDRELHIGAEAGVDRLKTRAHVALHVTDALQWRRKIESRGWPIVEQPLIEGYERFHFRDPFGNNIELIQRLGK